MRSSKGEHGPVLIDFLLHINGDMSERVMTVIESLVPAVEVYSIDESFADLTGVPDVEVLGRRIRAEVLRSTGIPVGVGIGGPRRSPSWRTIQRSAGRSRRVG